MQLLHIDLKPKGSPQATLTAYLPEPNDTAAPRPAVVICPGGAYAFVSPLEGEPVALDFVARGMAAFVLDYAVAPVRYPHALRQLAEAVALVRAHATAWGLSQKVIVAGFSAGGHLAASLGTLFAEPVLTDAGYDPAVIRPDALMLGYPVITSGKLAHRDSFKNLLGDSLEAAPSLALETRVSTQTPPTFIWTTADDQSVPAMNTLLFATALQTNGVAYELHVFPHGHHGLSLATPNTNLDDGEPSVAVWPSLFATWMQNQVQ